MKQFRKPDLNAPRYRPKKLNLLNQQFYYKLLEEYPELKGLSYEKVKDLIVRFNGAIRECARTNRNGVELPEKLGTIFIGSCPRKKSENINFKTSAEQGMKVQFRNFESDQYICKIFYTNFETRYRFRFHWMWGFEAHRDFTRSVGGENYIQNWKRYVVIDNLIHISHLFRQAARKQRVQKSTEELLKYYDEFDLE